MGLSYFINYMFMKVSSYTQTLHDLSLSLLLGFQRCTIKTLWKRLLKLWKVIIWKILDYLRKILTSIMSSFQLIAFKVTIEAYPADTRWPRFRLWKPRRRPEWRWWGWSGRTSPDSSSWSPGSTGSPKVRSKKLPLYEVLQFLVMTFKGHGLRRVRHTDPHILCSLEEREREMGRERFRDRDRDGYR